MKNTSSILTFITRLRQCCLDCSLVPTETLVQLLASWKDSTAGDTAPTHARLTNEQQRHLLDQFNAAFRAAGVKNLVREAEDDQKVDCAVCFETIGPREATLFRQCQHMLCNVCVEKLFEPFSKQLECPMCRNAVSREDCITVSDIQRPIDSRVDPSMSGNKDSSKTREIIATAKKIIDGSGDDKVTNGPASIRD